MLKEILVITLLLSQAMPLFSPHSDYVSVLPHNQLVSVTIVERPNNLALLQMYVQEHKVLNESQMEQLFIPRDKISSVTSYLSKFGIYTTSYLNVIEATGTVGQFERALGGEFVVIKFHDKTFYEYQGVTSPLVSNSLVFSSNVTQALLERPVTLYNITQAVAFSQVTPKQLQKVYNVTPLLSRG
jgi:Predicted protease